MRLFAVVPALALLSSRHGPPVPAVVQELRPASAHMILSIQVTSGMHGFVNLPLKL